MRNLEENTEIRNPEAVTASRRFIDMSNFIEKIITNDAARKGVAAFVAGVLVAFVQEALLGGQPSS